MAKKVYRIVPYGIYFRIQCLGKTFFRKRPKWYWCWICPGIVSGYIPSYPTTADAQIAIDMVQRND